MDILSQIDHPNCVKLYEIFDEECEISLVMELLSGGELFDRIVEKENYSEKEASDTIRPIVDAIRYCHNMGIIHRDLKPENLLYADEDEMASIKITDFGLARFVQGEMATTACGTPNYVAPEIIAGNGYNKEVDYWSIGVIIYIMLCGFPPFYEENNQQLFELIKNGTYDFPSPYWDDISDLAKDLIRQLLVVNPAERLDADAILAHPWIKGEDTPREELQGFTENMRQFNARRRLRKAGTMVIAVNRFKNTIKEKNKGTLKQIPSQGMDYDNDNEERKEAWIEEKKDFN